MRVLVFGATGGTGVELVKQCLSKGHKTSAFLHKNPAPLAPYAGKLTCFTGDVRDDKAVSAAVAGHDAVLVALGAAPGPQSEVLSIGTTHIVCAMQEHRVRRLVVETGAGLAENRETLPLLWRFMAALPGLRQLYAAKREQEKVVKESGLDWVIVRPVNLTNGPLTGKYRAIVNRPLPASATISRANVAHCMLDQDDWLRRALIVSETGGPR